VGEHAFAARETTSAASAHELAEVAHAVESLSTASEAPYTQYTVLLRHEGFRRLCLARDLLRVQREPSPSIAELAREVQISPFYFIRQFEALFGLTPHQFRIQTRLEAAKRLLATGDYSVTDVCMEVGFSSLGSFSTLFTRRVGEPPSMYRRRVRAMVQVPERRSADLTPGCLTLMCRLPPSAFSR
jgi:AraC-like DNA-binding protein